MPQQNSSSDLSGLTEKQLKFATWYVAHKLLLKKILITVLIASGFVFWGYGLYGLIDYYLIEGPLFSKTLKEWTRIQNFQAARARLQPKNLETGTVSILSAGKEKYDLIASVLNSNPRWRVEFNYRFVIDGEPLDEKKGFILPNEEKFLLHLGIESKTKPRRADLEILNLSWQRVDAHKIPDYPSWSEARLNFVLSDVKFSPAVIRDKIVTSRASFNVKNFTAYSYWEVGFFILLYRGTSLAGVNYITLEEFLSGQNRSVAVSWFEPLPAITQVKVLPEVNIFDKRVYMLVE